MLQAVYQQIEKSPVLKGNIGDDVNLSKLLVLANIESGMLF